VSVLVILPETSASTFNVFSVTKIILYKITRIDTSATTLNVFSVTKIILYKITRTDTSAHNFGCLPKLIHSYLFLLFNII
jgi:hypothetical protein